MKLFTRLAEDTPAPEALAARVGACEWFAENIVAKLA